MVPLALVTDPGRRPWLKAAAVGAALLVVPLAWWTGLALAGLRYPAPGPSPLTLALIVTAAVVVAPLIETAALALLHWLSVGLLRAPLALFVLGAVGVAVAAHLPLTLVRTPVTVAIFLIFALQYAGWHAERGWRTAFLGTALAHAVYNAGSLALSPVFAALLRPA